MRALYVDEHGELRAVDVELELPTWDEAELAAARERLAPMLAAGGVLLGAFEGERLAGVAVLGGAELAFLHVDRAHRGRGIARALLDEVCSRARDRGAEELLVSASDTDSSIRFYLGYGCRLAAEVDAELAALMPATDIQLTLDLRTATRAGDVMPPAPSRLTCAAGRESASSDPPTAPRA